MAVLVEEMAKRHQIYIVQGETKFMCRAKEQTVVEYDGMEII